MNSVHPMFPEQALLLEDLWDTQRHSAPLGGIHYLNQELFEGLLEGHQMPVKIVLVKGLRDKPFLPLVEPSQLWSVLADCFCGLPRLFLLYGIVFWSRSLGDWLSTLQPSRKEKGEWSVATYGNPSQLPEASPLWMARMKIKGRKTIC